MRTILIILTFLTLTHCIDSHQKPVSKNDRFELIPEPDKDLREAYEQQQKSKLAADTTYQEFMGETLKLIRKKLKRLSNKPGWTVINKIKTERNNGIAEYYYLKDELKKVRFLQNTDSTDKFTEYFIDNDSLFFVFERQTDKNDLKNDHEHYKPYEDSLFFNHRTLIKMKSNMDREGLFTEAYRKEKQTRLIAEFESLKEQLKNQK